MTKNTPSDAMVEAMAQAMKPELFKKPDAEVGPVTRYERQVAIDMATSAAAVIADALAERDAEIARLRETVARIVAWIRTGAMFAYTDQEMADAIEAGEWE